MIAESRDAPPETQIVNLLLFLLIGLAAGWLAGHLVKRRGSGWVEDMIIGVIGAYDRWLSLRVASGRYGWPARIADLRHHRGGDPALSAQVYPQGVMTELLRRCDYYVRTDFARCRGLGGSQEGFERKSVLPT